MSISRYLHSHRRNPLKRITVQFIAKRAEHASVLIDQRNATIRVIIEDDGVGFVPGAQVFGEKHLGVQGIRERAQLLGGKLTIESQPGRGTSLFIEIPLVSTAELTELERPS